MWRCGTVCEALAKAGWRPGSRYRAGELMAEYHRGPAPGTVLLFSPERDVRHLGFCFAFYSPCAKIELNGPINLLRLDCAEPQVLYPPPCTIDTLRGVGKAAE